MEPGFQQMVRLLITIVRMQAWLISCGEALLSMKSRRTYNRVVCWGFVQRGTAYPKGAIPVKKVEFAQECDRFSALDVSRTGEAANNTGKHRITRNITE